MLSIAPKPSGLSTTPELPDWFNVDAALRYGYVAHTLITKVLGTAVFVVIDEGAAALVYGHPHNGVAVRIQSACQSGEIFGSLHCDCRPQLDISLETFKLKSAGILFHLRDHEGRGSGIKAKAMAYAMNESFGLDTFSAYHHLGLDVDERTYERVGTFLGSFLRLKKIHLLTNNPEKINAMKSQNLLVERMPIECRVETVQAKSYLAAKRDSGHIINLNN